MAFVLLRRGSGCGGPKVKARTLRLYKKRRRKSGTTGKGRNQRLAEKREKLYAAAPWCYYCFEPMTFEESTIDHKTPLSRGGNSVNENLAICCKACNNAKGDMTEEEYWEWLAEPRP